MKLTRNKSCCIKMTARQKEAFIQEAEDRRRNMSQLFRLVIFGIETDGLPEPCIPRPRPMFDELKTNEFITRLTSMEKKMIRLAALRRDMRSGPMCVAILFGSDPRRVTEPVQSLRERAAEEFEDFYEEPPEPSVIREPIESSGKEV